MESKERTCIKGLGFCGNEPLAVSNTGVRGIKNGDIVKVDNEGRAILADDYVTERIIPGALSQDHGVRHDPITHGLDRGGSNNLISPCGRISKNCLGVVTSGFLVEVEKVTEAQMEEWRREFPEAFGREYDSASGLLFNSWITESKE